MNQATKSDTIIWVLTPEQAKDINTLYALHGNNPKTARYLTQKITRSQNTTSKTVTTIAGDGEQVTNDEFYGKKTYRSKSKRK